MSKRLLRLYPEAWRERYGEEMSALLDETPASLGATSDLLRGALVAHLRPPVSASPSSRARGTVTQVLGCFIVFCALGSGFAKTTENFDYVEHLHPLLGIAHAVIVIGAIVTVGALAVAAVPLTVNSVKQAWRKREPALVKLIAIPPGAIALFAGSVGVLALWLDSHRHSHGVVGWLLLALCALCAVLAGLACWAAPRAIMRRIDTPRAAFGVSLPALALVALGMAAVAVATGVFLVGIVVDAPDLAAAGNGPGGLIDVTTSIAIQFAGMLSLSAVAGVSATRGLRVVARR